ncbi:MAG: hypothetical protein ACXV3F_08990 [Frankiaceae bacterium]
MDARHRETCTYYLEQHSCPCSEVREWVTDLKAKGASPTVIRQFHTILSAVFTTAFNDRMTRWHPCHGVKAPPVAEKPHTIITPDLDQLYTALPTDTARLLAELSIESGLRWSELTDFRSTDLNSGRRMLTVSRVAVELVPRFHPTGGRFLVKDYPKDRERRRMKLAFHVNAQIADHIAKQELAADDLLFTANAATRPTQTVKVRRIQDEGPYPAPRRPTQCADRGLAERMAWSERMAGSERMAAWCRRTDSWSPRREGAPARIALTVSPSGTSDGHPDTSVPRSVASTFTGCACSFAATLASSAPHSATREARGVLSTLHPSPPDGALWRYGATCACAAPGGSSGSPGSIVSRGRSLPRYRGVDGAIAC